MEAVSALEERLAQRKHCEAMLATLRKEQKTTDKILGGLPMILYHGSTVIVDHPQILPGFRLLDFGAGFYTTRSYEQAERWAKTKMRRENGYIGFVSVYEFDEAAARQMTHIREFAQADASWLHFVVENRRGVELNGHADIHIGPVADDNVYAAIRLFETNVLDEEETIRRLKTETLHDQIAFHTEKALAYCRFLKAHEIRKEA